MEAIEGILNGTRRPPSVAAPVGFAGGFEMGANIRDKDDLRVKQQCGVFEFTRHFHIYHLICDSL